MEKKVSLYAGEKGQTIEFESGACAAEEDNRGSRADLPGRLRAPGEPSLAAPIWRHQPRHVRDCFRSGRQIGAEGPLPILCVETIRGLCPGASAGGNEQSAGRNAAGSRELQQRFRPDTTDNIIALQPSPDGRYVAIDGTRSDGELLWIFDSRYMTLNLEPANASGTFLHWLSASSDIFLYRPMFPIGPDAPLNGGSWNPGLWEVNAATGKITNLAIHGPSAYLVDAVASPDGSQIIYSTSTGLGAGSDIWTMSIHGRNSTHLLSLSNTTPGIAGLFAWSPNGQSIAYESLVDSPTPFLPAGVWIMNRQGRDRRFLAQADGGHGFALSWSPDSTKIAFVARANPGESMADQSTQSLKSAIEVVNVDSGHTWTAASSVQTGVQINASPVWSADSSRITFTAYNPLNPELGGTARYWSVSATPNPITPSAAPLSQPITHVIALG